MSEMAVQNIKESPAQHQNSQTNTSSVSRKSYRSKQLKKSKSQQSQSKPSESEGLEPMLSQFQELSSDVNTAAAYQSSHEIDAWRQSDIDNKAQRFRGKRRNPKVNTDYNRNNNTFSVANNPDQHADIHSIPVDGFHTNNNNEEESINVDDIARNRIMSHLNATAQSWQPFADTQRRDTLKGSTDKNNEYSSQCKNNNNTIDGDLNCENSSSMVSKRQQQQRKDTASVPKSGNNSSTCEIQKTRKQKKERSSNIKKQQRSQVQIDDHSSIANIDNSRNIKTNFQDQKLDALQTRNIEKSTSALTGKLVGKQVTNRKKSTSSSSLGCHSTHAVKSSLPPNQPQTTNDINYGAGRPIVVVHIAEKPSIAQAIASGLNEGGSTKSVGRTLPTHEFTNPPFPKAPRASKVTHRVTSVAGHVFSVDFPTEFQSWDNIDPAELFHAPVVKKACKGSVVRHLQDVTKGVDFMVLWMDCDREGENINFEVIDSCMHLMQGSDCFARVYRAHFSAINPSDIIKAYSTLGKPDRYQASSVDARQELDLKVGVAFSRFQTRYFQGRYGDLDSAILSYGPCQTPTLGFCVQRHVDIETFKSEPYWLLYLKIIDSGSICKAVWESGRSFNRKQVDDLVARCKNNLSAVYATVVSVVTKEKNQGRPTPLNTVALLKACSKSLGIGPHAALGIAERLYLSGYLSYPRTESTKYPNSFDIHGTLQEQKYDSRWGKYVIELLNKGFNVGKGGIDMGDHPPITPCRHAREGELTGDSARVYDLITRHFIASVSEDAVWRSTTIRISVEQLGEKGNFIISGKELATPGFLSIVMYKQYGEENNESYQGIEDEEERTLPHFKEGDQFRFITSATSPSDNVNLAPAIEKLATIDIKEKMTTPPSYITESELIDKMEKNGIGTDASISTHIENILKRNYVELIPGRKLKPSRLGLVLAQGYHLIDDSLVLPKIRSDIEDQCNKIAKGLADKDAVVKAATEMFLAKFLYFVENINKMDVLFSSSFAQLHDVGKPFTRCGFTRSYLQFIIGPPPRLYNKRTETVYPLPIGGNIKQWTGRNCTVQGCNFELCLYSVGAPPRTFPLCPNCFNNPRPEWGPICSMDLLEESSSTCYNGDTRNYQKIAGKNMVRECPHPDKHPIIEEMTVSPDPEGNGVLIVDPHLGPKWRLISTRAPTIVYLPKIVEKVTILDKKDEILGCHLISIEFKEGTSPVEGKKRYVSCFANDSIIQGLVRVYHGDEKVKAMPLGKKGHKKGKGKGNYRSHSRA